MPELFGVLLRCLPPQVVLRQVPVWLRSLFDYPYEFNFMSQATPIAIQPIAKDFPALTQPFFCRPAEVVGPELVGCRLVKRQDNGSLLWGVIVETEAYSQDDPACHGYRRRSPSNETLFGEPGRFYVYVSYGIHHCVKRAVRSRSSSWA